MADLTARFGADFTAFQTAVQQVEAELRAFDGDAKSVQGSLNRMTESFSGNKLIHDAELMTKAVEELGGTSKMTQAELARIGSTLGEAVQKMDLNGAPVSDKMRALADETKGAGKEVSILSGYMSQLGGMIAGAFTIQSVLSFGKAVMDMSGEIAKVSVQTGMTTDQVQKLRYVADQTSVSFGTLTSASQGLSDAIGSRDKGVAQGIRNLGINVDEFIQLDAYHQFVAVADALKETGNQADYSGKAAAVFGNKWKEIVPVLKEDIEKVGENISKLSKEQIAAMQAWEASWKSFTTTVEVTAGKAAVKLGELYEKVGFWQDVNMTATGGTVDLIKEWSLLYNAVATSSGSMIETLAKVPEAAIYPIGKAAHSTGVDLLEMADAEEELDKKLEASMKAAAAKEAEDLAAAMERARAAGEKWSNAVEEIEGAGTSWRDTLASINPVMVEHIQQLLQAGVNATAIATAYGINATTMAAYKDSVKDINKEIERSGDIQREAIRLDTALATQMIANTGSRLQVAIAAINQESELYRLSMQDKGKWNDELAAKEDALRQARIQGLLIDKTVLEKGSANSREALEERAMVARATYDAMIAEAWKYSAEDIAAQGEVVRTTEMAMLTIGGAAQKAADAHSKAAAQVALSWSQAMDAVRASQGSMSGSTNAFPASASEVQDAFNEHRYFGPMKNGKPDYAALGLPDPSQSIGWSAGMGQWGAKADGGPVSAGSPYLVGERGPELFVPNQSGGIVPNGAGGSVVANIYVNGTGQDVARIINQELTRMMRVGRKWPSV